MTRDTNICAWLLQIYHQSSILEIVPRFFLLFFFFTRKPFEKHQRTMKSNKIRRKTKNCGKHNELTWPSDKSQYHTDQSFGAFIVSKSQSNPAGIFLDTSKIIALICEHLTHTHTPCNLFLHKTELAK